MSSQINSQCPNREFDHGGQLFSLELRTITGDVDMPQNNFKTADFNPQGNLLENEILLPSLVQSSMKDYFYSNFSRKLVSVKFTFKMSFKKYFPFTQICLKTKC